MFPETYGPNMQIHSTPLITIARGTAFFIGTSEYRYRRKWLYTSIVAGIVKLHRYNRNIVINRVECKCLENFRPDLEVSYSFKYF